MCLLCLAVKQSIHCAPIKRQTLLGWPLFVSLTAGEKKKPGAYKMPGFRNRCLQVIYRTLILNRGFRWARAARRWVHLTRDDHAHQAMYQARAQGALVQGNIKPGGLADNAILRAFRGVLTKTDGK